MATAKLSVKKAEIDVSLHEVRAPARGKIASIKKHSGEAVKQFETVFEIIESEDR